MASFDVAFGWIMQFEDPQGCCAVTPDAPPSGCSVPCYAISGINSGAWPADFGQISAIPQDQRMQAVHDFYQANFWNTWYDQLYSDHLAKRVFDFAVNGGSGAALKCLQRGINALGGNVTVDGGWGPDTVAAANSFDPGAMIQAYVDARCAYYQSIVANNPQDAKYLNGWLKRAQT
jgi:lysozyme family protein